MSRPAHYALSRGLFSFGWLYFMAFVDAYLLIGGSAEKVQDGVYYVADHGVSRGASPLAYYWILWQERTLPVGVLATLLGFAGIVATHRRETLDEAVRRDPSYLKTPGPSAGMDAVLQLRDPPPGIAIDVRSDGFQVSTTRDSVLGVFVLLAAPMFFGPMLGDLAWGLVSDPGSVDRSDRLTLAALATIPALGMALLLGIGVFYLVGREYVSVTGFDADLFVGIGGVGLHRRFDWRNVRAIEETERRWTGQLLPIEILLQNGRRLRFAERIPDVRRHYILTVLRAFLAQRPDRSRQVPEEE